MKFKRFRERDQAFLKEANDHGLEFALVIKADDKDSHHEVIGVACCMGHLNIDGMYAIVYIRDMKGFDDEI